MARPLLSRNRRTMLDAIAYFWMMHGYAPAVKDLMAIANVASSSTVVYHLAALRRFGWLRQDAGVARSLRLTAAGWRESNLMRPCCGHAAGVDKVPAGA